MIIVRCKECNTEICSNTKTQVCGCPNMMIVTNDKVSAVDLSQIVMIKLSESKISNKLSAQDLAFQEARKKRKVRKMNYEER